MGLYKRNTRQRRNPQSITGGWSTSPVHHRGGAVKVACYEWLQGTAGGVGESSGINRLTDVPKFRRVRHRRRSFTRVLRSEILRSSPIKNSRKSAPRIAPVQHLGASLDEIGFLRGLSDLPWLPHSTHRTGLTARRLLAVRIGAMRFMRVLLLYCVLGSSSPLDRQYIQLVH
jgi:hypothetical protein